MSVAVQTPPHVTLGGVALQWRADRSALTFDALGKPDALLVADVHLGKAQRYRDLGQSVPHAVMAGTTAATLQRLRAALNDSGARRLIVLGDLVHGPAVGDAVAALAETLGAWHDAAQGHVTVIGGNHDRRAMADWGPVAERLRAAWEVLPEDDVVRLGGLALTHRARVVPGAQDCLGGHLHPCWVMRGPARDRVRLPCVWLQQQSQGWLGTLPAFGDFTGMHAVPAAPGDRLWVLTPDGGVHALPASAISPGGAP